MGGQGAGAGGRGQGAGARENRGRERYGRLERKGREAGVQRCRSEMQNATRRQITHHQLPAPASNSNTCDLEAAPELKHGNGSDRDVLQPHTGIYAIRNRSNFFSLFISNEIEENDGIMINYPNLNCH